ncbi:DUF4345 family protein [Gimesia algae]|uniref:DUF4345 domain-containing protein n=1 Tax=Gimesia algae TaxID=2527971 RepID=A0A517VI35_9PLAN|nr:DUF4345 family protein [Gimesia algae]QDT92648.1 hypothetical protein Pan161_43160 [Gimesia algae]
MTRIFLTVVGLVYLLLALWCSVDPASASRSVGFILESGSGQSEFLVVYGGLELALGIIFLWPLWQPGVTRYSLIVCIIVHGCLVLFRSTGFVIFEEIASMTYSLAVGEWLIFLISLGLFYNRKKSDSSST